MTAAHLSAVRLPTAHLSAVRLPTVRLPQWQLRLAELFASRWSMPLRWGTHDCCLFAADAVQACTGHDPAADIRGTYRTQAEAAQVLQRLGGVVEIAIARAGPVVRTAHAAAGDIGVIPAGPANPWGPALVVCGGPHWLAAGTAGLVSHPTASVLRAWRCTAAPSRAGAGGA